MEPQLVVSDRAQPETPIVRRLVCPIFTILTVIGFFGIAHFYLPARRSEAGTSGQMVPPGSSQQR
jgi:hypothetical protein